MAKTIGDYKKDYADARARGDAAGMKAANDGANAIRASMGQASQSASADIARTASRGSSSGGSSGGSSSRSGGGGSSGGYQTYGGGNAQLDRLIQEQSDRYFSARAAGDSRGMQEANDRANQLRNQYGYAAQFANEDINKFRGQSGGFGGGGGGGYSPQTQQYQQPDSYPYQQAMQDYLSQQMAQQQSYYQQLMEEQRRQYAQQQAQLQAQQQAQQNRYQQLLDEQQRKYEEIKAQQEAAKRAAVEQAVGNLSGQKTGLEQNYQDLYRQLYLDRRMAEKKLPQQMSAMGISGGMTESTALDLQTSYADALRQGEIAKRGTLSGLDQAIANTRLTGDISIADQAAQTAKDQIAAYGDTVGALQQQENWMNQFGYQQSQDAVAQQNWLSQFGYQQAMDNRNFHYQAGRDQVSDSQWNQSHTLDKYLKLQGLTQDQLRYEAQRQDADQEWRLAAAQYLYENTGDASGLKMLGYNDSQIAALRQSYLQQSYGTPSSGGGGGAGGGSGRKRSTASSTSSSNQKSKDSGGQGKGIIESMLSSGSQARAYEYLITQGLSQGKTDQLWSLYLEEYAKRRAAESKPQKNWTMVPGFGRLTKGEVDAMLKRGEILKSYNPGTGGYIYRKNPDYRGK